MAGFDNDVCFGINADFSNALSGTGASTTGELLTNGQLWIGSTATNAGGTHINVGTISSPDGSITFGYSSPNITAQVTGGSTSVITLTGNSGVATPSSGNINVITANSTVKFVGSGANLTQDFGLTNLLIGNSGSAIIGGAGANVGVGTFVFNALTSGSGNTSIGSNSGQLLTSGTSNTFLGANSGQNFTGNFNTAIGQANLTNAKTGSYNVGLGYNSGSNYTTSESSNIIISNSGTAAESNVIRIGTQGSGNGQQNQCYLAGVLNTVSGRVVKTTSPGAYPYTTLVTDYLILVDSSSSRVINLISSPVTGTTYRIKDNTGSAAANNITITPAAGNIDGSGTYVINNNYGSVDLSYTGTKWIIL